MVSYFDFPSQCPYCNKDIVPNPKSVPDGEKYHNKYFRAELHLCIHCGAPIYIFLASTNKAFEDPARVVLSFPLQENMDYPRLTQKLSPNAYNIYSHTIRAKQLGFNTLVGAGLRMALEQLMFDYLTKLVNISSSDLKSKKLHQLIDMVKAHNTNLYTDVCTKLIKAYGNDQIHIFSKTDLTEDEIINAFNVLLTIIEAEINLLNVNNRQNGQPDII